MYFNYHGVWTGEHDVITLSGSWDLATTHSRHLWRRRTGL